MDKTKQEEARRMIEQLNTMNYVYGWERKLSDKRRNLFNKLSNVINFINKDVVGKNTASLIKTDVILEVDKPYYGQNDVKKILTINQKGFGTIREVDSGWAYGTHRSEEMREDEFIKYIFDESVQAKLLIFLEKENKRKMLKICKIVFNQLKSIKEIKNITKKYQREMYVTDTEEFEVSEQYIDTDDKQGTSTTIIKPMTVNKMTLTYNGDLVFINKEEKDPNNEVMRGGGRKWGSTYNGKSNVVVNLGSLEGLFSLYPIKEEIDNILTKIENNMNQDEIKSKEFEDKIHEEFSAYLLMKEIENME